MKAICDSLHRHFIQLKAGFALLLFLCLVVNGCRGEQSKVAKVDLANGAVKGTLEPAPEGTVVVLCRAGETSCVPLPELSDAINRRGEFAISLVPPGHYVFAYAFPNDLNQGKLNIATDETLVFEFGNDMKIEATMKEGKWSLSGDSSSDTHMIAAGAELVVGLSGAEIANCSVRHKASGLWMEYREGHRYESVEIEANKVAEFTLNRWSGN